MACITDTGKHGMNNIIFIEKIQKKHILPEQTLKGFHFLCINCKIKTTFFLSIFRMQAEEFY